MHTDSGNEAAHRGDYPLAILQFSEAIKLEPCDYRFFGNRSYCYDRIMQFDKYVYGTMNNFIRDTFIILVYK